jgi:hypothetical protein
VQSGKTASGGCSAGQGSSEPVAPRIYYYYYYYYYYYLLFELKMLTDAQTNMAKPVGAVLCF